MSAVAQLPCDECGGEVAVDPTTAQKSESIYCDECSPTTVLHSFSVEDLFKREGTYLAGPVMYADGDGKRWREMVKEEAPEVAWIDPVEELNFTGEYTISPEALVDHDKTLLRSSESMLVGLTDEYTIGTWREVEYAKETLGIPVVFWDDPYNEGTRDWGPWALEAGGIFHDLQNCLDHLDTRKALTRT